MVSCIKYAFSIAIILGVFNTAFAIRCKVCNSPTKTDCDDPFKAGDLYDTDCDRQEKQKPYNKEILGARRNATGCLKLQFENKEEGPKFIHRMCYWGDTKNVTGYCQGIPNSMSCDICTTDLCNSSTKLQTIALAFGLIFIFSLCSP